YVLCGASRRDILLGKNLAFAPLALGLGAIMVGVLQVLAPLRLDHLMAFVFQAVTMYFLYCLLVNVMSILAPMQVPAGSFKPRSVKGVQLLVHLSFLVTFPMVMGTTLLPMAAELALDRSGLVQGAPIALALSLLGCVGAGCLYWVLLPWEGRW